ncbi:MAG: hypothetical protein WCB46_09315 [Methanoregula sp.]
MHQADCKIGKQDPLPEEIDKSVEDVCGPRQQETVPDDEDGIAFPDDQGKDNGKGAGPVFPDPVYPASDDAQLLSINA